ncbi:MAG: hypothetical protein JXQ69_09520 [Paludibacteraceae bacterium]|nr:hypothetical protein [Paludibacteraceae bacterium]MBN2788544.1 hypothetical protein [Paludibacteraceae bacterium]
MKKIILFSLFVISAGELFAQKSTYIGLEIPIERTEFSSDVNEANATIFKSSSPKFGLNIRQDLSDIFAIETGLMYTPYNRNLYAFPVSNSNIVNNFSHLVTISTEPTPDGYPDTEQVSLKSVNLSKWEIPIRFITKIHLYKNVFLATQLGCILNTNAKSFNKNTVITAYKIVDPNINITDITNEYRIQNLDTTKYVIDYTSNRPSGIGIALEAGLALEYKTKNGAFFKGFINYVKGFNTLLYDYIKLTPENESTRISAIKSTGNYYSFGISYFYPISNFWKKKPEVSN